MERTIANRKDRSDLIFRGPSPRLHFKLDATPAKPNALFNPPFHLQTPCRTKCPTWALGVCPIHSKWPYQNCQLTQFPAFNHDQSSDAEAEYDRLRDLARQEASKRGACFQKVRPPVSHRRETG